MYFLLLIEANDFHITRWTLKFLSFFTPQPGAIHNKQQTERGWGWNSLLGIHEGHDDISGSLCGGEALVQMCEAAGVHQDPSDARIRNRAVIPDESAAASLSKKTENIFSYNYAKSNTLFIDGIPHV